MGDLRVTHDEVIQEARDRAALLNLRHPNRGCLYLAWSLAVVLQDQGCDAQIQAGTAQFLAVPAELDDGVSPNAYSYVYEPEVWTPEATARSFETGQLPEMHCWVAIVSTGEIIDASLRDQPGLAEIAGIKWTAPRPDYFWGTISDCKAAGYVYCPDVNAIRTAYLAIDLSG